METLETSLETVGSTLLSLDAEMETQWKHFAEVETPCPSPFYDRSATESVAALKNI